MGHLVVAEFEMGAENVFDRFFTYASDEMSGVKVFGLKRLSPDFVSNLEKMEDGHRQATEEIIKNDWFWTFNPECGWEMDRENNKAIVGIDWYVDSTEYLNKIKEWLLALGGSNVHYKKGYDNFEEME